MQRVTLALVYNAPAANVPASGKENYRCTGKPSIGYLKCRTSFVPSPLPGARMSFFDRRLRPARFPAAARKDAMRSTCSKAQYRTSQYRTGTFRQGPSRPASYTHHFALRISKVTTTRQTSCKMQSCKMQVIRQRRILSIIALSQRPILSRAKESTAKCMSLRFMHGLQNATNPNLIN